MPQPNEVVTTPRGASNVCSSKPNPTNNRKFPSNIQQCEDWRAKRATRREGSFVHVAGALLMTIPRLFLLFRPPNRARFGVLAIVFILRRYPSLNNTSGFWGFPIHGEQNVVRLRKIEGILMLGTMTARENTKSRTSGIQMHTKTVGQKDKLV